MRNINAIMSNVGLLNYWTNRLLAGVIDWTIVWFFMAVFSISILGFSFYWNYGVLLVLYFTVLESVLHTTPGKRIFSIRLEGDFTVLAVLIRNISKLHLTVFIFELLYSAIITSDPKKRFLDSFTDISVSAPGSFLDFEEAPLVPGKASVEPTYSRAPVVDKAAHEKRIPAWRLYLLRKIVQYFGSK